MHEEVVKQRGEIALFRSRARAGYEPGEVAWKFIQLLGTVAVRHFTGKAEACGKEVEAAREELRQAKKTAKEREEKKLAAPVASDGGEGKK